MCHGHEIDALREYLREAEEDRTADLEADADAEDEPDRVPAPADD